MDLLSIILIAIGLAMDCFAVSVTKGVQTRHWAWQAGLMALLFGLFQGAMPLLGYWAGSLFTEWVCRFDHWIALLLLSIIGGKMIYESKHPDEDSKQTDFSLTTILLLAIATSIDALATGLLFVPVPEQLWLAVSVIALTSLLLSLIGFTIGCKVGKHLKINVELLGGLILIGIGLKIFIQHAFINGELLH